MATITLVVGPQNAGKTTKMLEIFESLTKGSAQGVIQPKIFDVKNRWIGYALRNLVDASNYPLILLADDSSSCPTGWFACDRFRFCEATFQYGVDLLNEACFDSHIKTILIDEIGNIEVEGKGYDNALRNVLISSKDVILALSDVHLDQILETYGIRPDHWIRID
jgi:nucleoside-triphosphatase THEP1